MIYVRKEQGIEWQCSILSILQHSNVSSLSQTKEIETNLNILIIVKQMFEFVRVFI